MINPSVKYTSKLSSLSALLRKAERFLCTIHDKSMNCVAIKRLTLTTITVSPDIFRLSYPTSNTETTTEIITQKS